MAWWTDRVLPRVIDRVCATGELQKLRATTCASLHGDVVEIGFGSGLNIPHYPTAVSRVSAIEPADAAWRLSERRRGASRVDVDRSGLDGQRLDLPDASHDCALSTFTMCTIPDLDAALAELRRVLRPGGTLHFLEHGRAADDRVARWQERITPVHRHLAGGCHLDRPIPQRIRSAGFEIVELDQFYGQGPKVTSYLSLGRARRP
jgi:ubiquinone/menaquinone biosynthesis C-methylase UbiE